MSQHTTHANHTHVHSASCGHLAVRHGDHVDYVHDGHLHHVHDGHVDECAIDVDSVHPRGCTPAHACGAHDRTHVHSATCGHAAVPHGDHVDYLVEGHLHHPCKGHCDDHGPLSAV